MMQASLEQQFVRDEDEKNQAELTAKLAKK